MRLRQIFTVTMIRGTMIVGAMIAGLTVTPWDFATAQTGARDSNAFNRQLQAQAARQASVRRKPLSRILANTVKTNNTGQTNPGRKPPQSWKPEPWKAVVDGRPKVPPKAEPKRPGTRPTTVTPNDSANPNTRPGRRPPVVVLPLSPPPPPPVIRPPLTAGPSVTSPPLPPARFVPPLQPRQAEPPLPGSPPLVPSQQPVPPVLVTAPEFVPDEVLITVATTALPELEVDLATAFNVTVIERIPLPLIDARLIRLRIPDGRAVATVVSALIGDPRVMFVQPNYIYRLNGELTPTPTPTPAASAATPSLQYALAKLEVTELHRLALGRGTTVAVIDSGVDSTHPDFAGAQIVHFDATGDTTTRTGDLDSHGTGVAGIIAARGIVQGLAPGAAIVSARVFRKGPSGSVATTEAILKGITWSAEKGARVLNMSFAGPHDPLVERHIKVTTARGMVAIAAAGNNGVRAAPAYPAAYDDVVAVTAVDASDRLFVQANRGRYISVAAPGVDVIVPSLGHAHQFQSGTSMAAAHVSAVVALLLEIDPRLSPQDVRQLLMSSSEDLGVSGRDDEFGSGRVNAMRAIRQLRRR